MKAPSNIDAMTRPDGAAVAARPFRLALVVGLAALMATPLAGCADAGSEGTGSMKLALRDGVGGWLRLRIFKEDPGAALDAPSTFDTNCLDAQSRTYELTSIPAGADQWVVIEAFDKQDCSTASRVEVGYRGGVNIPEGAEAPYYHVPLYEEGGLTALPESLNISASEAKRIQFCDPADNSTCEAVAANHKCYDALKPEYWCVPACTTSSDCASYHPGATCEVATGWCMLNSPYPLNLSEPRAFGHGGTLANGDAVFIGGFGKISTGKLLPGNQPVETFNQSVGLFEKQTIAGLETWSGAGLSGFAALGADRFVVVGGVTQAALGWSGDGGARKIRFEQTTAFSSEIVVFDMAGKRAGVAPFPIPVASPVVVALDSTRVLVVSGRTTSTDSASEDTNDAFICTIAAGSVTASCKAAGQINGRRSGASGACIDAACSEVLVVGGRDDNAVAERVTVSGDTVSGTALTVSGPLTSVKYTTLCGFRLLGGATGGSVGTQTPVALTLAGDTLTASALGTGTNTVWPAIARDAAGDCWVAGGIGADGVASDAVYRMTDSGRGANPMVLNRGRFGAVAAWVSGGPIDGAILYGGGLILTGGGTEGSVDIVRGVEVLKP